MITNQMRVCVCFNSCSGEPKYHQSSYVAIYSFDVFKIITKLYHFKIQ